jgi:spore germination protein KA
MLKLSKNSEENIEIIRNKTGNSPDIIIKNLSIFDNNIYIIINETLADKTYIDDYVLKFFEIEKLRKKVNDADNILEYLKQNITTNKTTVIDNFDDVLYNILSGFTVVLIDGFGEALSLETRAQLNSGIKESQNEMVVKGPKDAFTENYQTNIGLIRKRLKTEDLWLEEIMVGTKSKTRVGIMYVKSIASKKLVDMVLKKVKEIKIDSIFDSNYIIELISGNKSSVFANYLSTERPDLTSMHLLDGRIAIIVENTQYIVIVPGLFVDFFHTTEDFYQKVSNVNFTRVVRLIAFFVAIIVPAFYIAIATYNVEAIPDKLLMSFVTQRMGVPLPTVDETIMMIIVFEIIRETDTRLPNAIGSSLSIVGALVLGQAAIQASVVSPITIIVVAMSSICGMITYNMDMTGGVRW